MFLAVIRCGRRGWVLMGLLLAGALLATYTLIDTLSPKSITLTMGNEVYHFNTQADTVGAALEDADVLITSEDKVTPHIISPLHDGDTITVHQARVIALGADDELCQVRTRATHPLDVLNSQHISLAPHDAIRVDGQTYSAATLENHLWNESFRTIFVLRGVMMTTIERGTTGKRLRLFYTTQADVGRALDDAGITLYLADRVTPGLSAPVEAGLVVQIDRSMPVTVIADGRTLETRVAGPTVGDALASLGIAPVDQDITIPPEEALLEPTMTIQLVRVTEEIVVDYESIPFSTAYRPRPDLLPGEQIDMQTGQAGQLERHYRARYADSIETERQIISERVIQEPVPRVIGYGHNQ